MHRPPLRRASTAATSTGCSLRRAGRNRLSWLLFLALAAGSSSALSAAPSSARTSADERAAIAQLTEAQRAWLEQVELLLTPEERSTFLGLREGYQRDAFIKEFWRHRDPHPETARNEMKDRWEESVVEALALFGSLRDARSRYLLLHGPPGLRVELAQRDIRSGPGALCAGIVVPTEVWYYERSSRVGELFVVFYRPFGVGNFRVWYAFEGLRALLVANSVRLEGPGGKGAREALLAACREPAELLFDAMRWIGMQGEVPYAIRVFKAELPPPPPSGEWVPTFVAYSTDLPASAATFPATVELSPVGRHQSRTVVRATVRVPARELRAASLAGGRPSFDLLLNGEVLRGTELFDRFRYKFHLPAPDHPPTGDREDDVVLVFERPLRPGDFRLVLRLEDLVASRFARVEQPLVVPAAESVVAEADTSRAATAEATAERLPERSSIRLLPPLGDGMRTGRLRFEAQVAGEAIAAVAFALDGQTIATKRQPPWSLELDLGQLPRARVLRASALAEDGSLLAEDELVVNSSGNRFTVRFTSPRPRERHLGSVRVETAVEVPVGQRLQRLELYRDETLVATLYDPPWEVPLPLVGQDLTVLRAVGYLADGLTADAHVFVNAPPGMEDVDVRLVELYTRVTGRDGRPVGGLAAEDFQVRENDVPQQLVRCERVEDLPLQTAILLDTSASMKRDLGEAQQAALSFWQETLTPRDRAALITFNDRPRLQVRFTNHLLDLAEGLAGLEAERGTALYDSIAFALLSFDGLSGQRALIVLSDGKDESSDLRQSEALELARRAGVTIYTVGLGVGIDVPSRNVLRKLASETGGQSYFVGAAAELVEVYRQIQGDLRAQYLLVYQSTDAGHDRGFRTVDVRLRDRGLEATTLRGYYP